MNQIAKDTIKFGIAFAIIGVAVSVVAPLIAEILPLDSSTIQALKNAPPPLANGISLGILGAMTAFVPMAVGKVFGLSKEAKAPKIMVENGKGVSLSLQQSQEVEHSPLDVEAEQEQPAFTAKIVAKREQGAAQNYHQV